MTTICDSPARRRAASSWVGWPVLSAALVLGAGALSAARAASPPPRGSQTANMVSPWTAWIGCWEPQTSSSPQATDEVPAPEVEREAAPPPAPATALGLRVCITPTGDDGAARLITLADDRIVLEETIVADGAKHPVEEAGCSGWRRAEWSQDGERLFSNAELSCGSEPLRKVSGVTLMASGPRWIEVQVVDSGGKEGVRIRRYGAASIPDVVAGRFPQALAGTSASAAQRLSTSTLSIEDIVEAGQQVVPKAVEAALVETQASFDLDRRVLVTLADAHVPKRLIDLMVALSYPRHFVVERSDNRFDWAAGGGGLDPLDAFWMFPTVWSAQHPAYSYMAAPYSYSPFGYGYGWGGIDSYQFFEASPRDAGPDETSSGEVRVVDGLGYTRVHPRDESGAAVSRGGSADSAGASIDSGGGSSGGAVSSQGYSSSGGGSDSGRTAEPR